MSDHNNFDFESMMDALSSNMEAMLEDMLASQIENAVTCSLQDALPKALSESLSGFEFVLPDGTMITPRPSIKLLSPDKSKLLLCYGGLRVDGCSLTIQTGASSWETIAIYPSKEYAVAALIRVKNAMEAGVSILEL